MDTGERDRLQATFDLDERAPELRAATADLTSDEIRTAVRLLERGEGAHDPRVARLVVTLAERRRKGAGMMVFTWLCCAGLVAWALIRLVTGDRDAATWILLGLAVTSVLGTIREAVEYRRLPRAERANRELAEAAGPSPVPADAARITTGPWGAVQRTLPTYLISGAVFALLDVTISGKPLTVARIVLVAAL